VVEGRRNKVTALISRHPYIPWKCYFYNTIWSLLSVVSSLVGGVAILYALNVAFKWYKQQRQREQEEEMALVENIIDVLQSNATDTGDNYMVVNHVRDMILPINERKSERPRPLTTPSHAFCSRQAETVGARGPIHPRERIAHPDGGKDGARGVRGGVAMARGLQSQHV
jgi:hypothetical protein